MTLDEALRQRNRDITWRGGARGGIWAAGTELSTKAVLNPAVLNPARLWGYSQGHTKWPLLLLRDISVSFSTIGSKLSRYLDLPRVLSWSSVRRCCQFWLRAVPFPLDQRRQNDAFPIASSFPHELGSGLVSCVSKTTRGILDCL